MTDFENYCSMLNKADLEFKIEDAIWEELHCYRITLDSGDLAKLFAHYFTRDVGELVHVGE